MKESEYNREWKIALKEIDFKYKILSGLHLPIKKLSWEVHLNFSIWPELKKENPDIVILDGYDAPTIWLALLWTKLRRKKVVFWIGSTLFSSKKNKGIIGRIKRFFIKLGDSFIAYGQSAKEYLLFLGAKKEMIFTGCNVCDQDFFRNGTNNYRERPEFFEERKTYPLVLFLFVGRLIRGKGIIELLRALYETKDKNWGLIIIGNGPLYSEIKKFIEKNDLKQKIWLFGFKQKDELIRYYALADIFLFPSLQEPYGIVISEALTSGLFCLSSKYAGASYDLIQEGINGCLIDPKNPEDLKTKIELVIKKIMEKPWNRNEISNSIKKFTSEYYGQKVIEAVKKFL